MSLFSTPLWRLCLLLTLLAGCQSARSSFSFRPPAAAPRSAAMMPPVVSRQNSSHNTLVLPGPVRARPLERLVAVRPRLAQRVAALAVKSTKPIGSKALTVRGYLVPLIRHRAASAPAGVAESGLGTTFIGILGILLLAVGLVGLLLAGWGFFGWLAVAGAVGLLISILAPSFGW